MPEEPVAPLQADDIPEEDIKVPAIKSSLMALVMIRQGLSYLVKNNKKALIITGVLLVFLLYQLVTNFDVFKKLLTGIGG